MKKREFMAAAFKSVLPKLSARLEKKTADEAALWCSSRSTSWEAFANERSESLGQESLKEWHAIEARFRSLNPLDLAGFGGGGCVPLVYFLVRYVQPAVVIETGVAAGWSSEAILRAMDKNQSGHLFSSDLPYLFRSNFKLIGFGVSSKLKSRWTLNLKGDRRAVPLFLENLETVNLIHYDSDKSFSGRKWFLNFVKSKLKKNSVIIMDDIEDNVFFKEFVTRHSLEYQVIEFKNKYIGVITNLEGFL